MKRKKALVLASLIAVSIISNLRICYAECIYSRGDVIRFTDNYDSIEDASDSVDIQGLFSKKKTVKKNYKNFNSIPSSIYYEEYIDNCMWGGTLKWTGESKEVGHGIFQATFKGKLKKLS